MQLNLEEGKRRKRKGQQQALENSGPVWMAKVEYEFRKFLLIREQRKEGNLPFCFEEFRRDYTFQWLPQPKSHQAWGAFANAMVKKGLVKYTGEVRPAYSAKTHGHYVRYMVKA